jgi:hypothetical protein
MQWSLLRTSTGNERFHISLLGATKGAKPLGDTPCQGERDLFCAAIRPLGRHALGIVWFCKGWE